MGILKYEPLVKLLLLTNTAICTKKQDLIDFGLTPKENWPYEGPFVHKCLSRIRRSFQQLTFFRQDFEYIDT